MTVASNFLGTEFSAQGAGLGPGAPAAELAAVLYRPNVLGMRGPRQVTVVVPKLSGRADRAAPRAAPTPLDTLLARCASATRRSSIKHPNRQPYRQHTQHHHHTHHPPCNEIGIVHPTKQRGGSLRKAAAAVGGAPGGDSSPPGCPGPGSCSGVLPSRPSSAQPPARPAHTACCRYKRYELPDCVVLRNKEPRWNEALQAYCLNFGGRVTHPSVKNFQLASVDNAVRMGGRGQGEWRGRRAVLYSTLALGQTGRPPAGRPGGRAGGRPPRALRRAAA
jgi:hypothetical protein